MKVQVFDRQMFGRMIKSRLMHGRWTLREAGSRYGLSASTICRAVHGKCVNVEATARLLSFLGLQFETFT